MTRLRISIIAALSGVLFLIPGFAHAGPAFYADAGGSLVKIRSEDPFWGSNDPSAGFGYGLNFGIFTTFTNSNPTVELQFGLLDRYSSASASNPQTTYQLMSVYPVLRLQLSRLYFSAGGTPFVMRGLSSSAGNYGLTRVNNAISYLGEVGILYPVTPKFSFGTSLSAEYVHVDESWSPKPLASANFFMRFYFGFGEGGGSRNSTEFRGWRYPFGRDF
jgi:hypothetical protein